MPSIHDFRADFRRGRTGDGLRINQKAGAYSASLFDANNFLVTSKGHAERRWPTEIKNTLMGESRIEGAELGVSDALRFVLVFSNARLDVYDLSDLTTPVNSFTSQPWTDETKWFMSITKENVRFNITDQTFAPRILEFDPDAGTFSMNTFEFDLSKDGLRLRAPFYSFASKTMRATSTNYLAKGHDTGIGANMAIALGVAGTTFNLTTGAGELTTDEDFFVSTHAGTRMRLGAGEFTVNTVVDARNADITVERDIAIELDVDPFFISRNETRVEVAAENHNLAVGDEVIFYGLTLETSDYAASVLRSALKEDGTTDGLAAAAYTVAKVVDAGHFEVEGDAGVPQATGLYGGSHVYMIPKSGILEIQEPAFSEARGWPQAAGFHESRLFLGGTLSLPDAAWGSIPFNTRDFDTGEGSDLDAIALYGIGDQSRVRHFVSSFDLLIFTENGEYYTPGSTDQALTQETARARDATKHGVAYTKPQKFDGSVFFIDSTGNHVRDMQIRSAEAGYYAPPASVVVSDWVRRPEHSVVYPGSAEDTTPYIIFGKDETGALLVMHSSRQDEAFGFMRWTLDEGSFLNCATVGQQLFVSAELDGTHYLLEFKTDGTWPQMDFVEKDTGSAQTAWSSSYFVSQDVQLVSERRVYSDQTLDASGNFTSPEALDEIYIGKPMSYKAEFNAPITGSGQGPKIGKTGRLVSSEVHWRSTETGTIDALSEFGRTGSQQILSASDNPSFQAPTPVDQWREYTLGAWGRESRMIIEGSTPGAVAMRGVILNAYF